MIKNPNELEVGEFFSYRGSFKVYKVQTKPREDVSFGETHTCPLCKQEATSQPRIIFEVADGDLRDRMGIRLRYDAECTMHKSYSLQDLVG